MSRSADSSLFKWTTFAWMFPGDTSLKSTVRRGNECEPFSWRRKCAIDFSNARRPRKLRSGPSFREFRTPPDLLMGP
ncbi:hypothetical protein CEXT_307961 [Caerostris extrusa]|uniref:Uncharacterized protein n=1 Tax=Caerostris extrusa TaxID=172846 RepID=A0AAV4VWZ5_CAEEX|nr:hypothetical protein CEXT_307961 [Caerostris extrusa]